MSTSTRRARRKESRLARAEASRPGRSGGGTSWLRVAGIALLCAKVALIPLVFDPAADFPFDIPKALLSHALAYALAGVLIGLFIELGRSFFVWSWLHVPVLVFLAVNVLATLFAADSLLALYGAHVRMLGLGTVADGVILYFAIVLLVRTRKGAIALVASAVGTSLIVLLYEVLQLLGKDPIAWGYDTSLRPPSTFGQINSLALYLAALAFGFAALAIFDRQLASRLRFALGAYSVALLAGVIPTLTRAALLGVAAGGLLLIVLTWVHFPSRVARRLVGAGTLAAAAVLAIVLVLTPLGSRVVAIVEVTEPAPATADATDTAPEEPAIQISESGQTRLALYRIATDMLRARPLVGYGPDNLAVGVTQFRSEDEPFEVQQSTATSAHSWVAQVAASTGLLGLASFVAIAVVALVVAIRGPFTAAVAAGAATLAAFLGTGLITINDISTEWLFWAAVGTVAAATGRPLQVRPRTASRARTWAGIACALIGAVLALTPLNAFQASRLAYDSRGLRFSLQYAQAIAPALRATQLDPQRAEYWEGLGLAYVGTQRLTDAVAAFGQASKLAPYNVRYDGQLARAYAVLVQRGDTASVTKAREVADRAVSVDGNNPRAHQTRALVMQVTGNLPEAIRSVERAFSIDQQSGNAGLYVTASQVYLSSGRIDDAIRIARQGTVRVPPVPSVEIRVELARALAAKGQQKEALAELDEALKILPGHRPAQAMRAEISSQIPRS